MVPVLELRGAIPYGVAHDIPLWHSIFLSVFGNFIPAPLIILFIPKIFQILRKFSRHFNALVSFFEERARTKGDVVQRHGFWGLVLLVAIPLPGTGAWTGALVAALMEIRLKWALPAIAIGILIAAIIVSCITFGVAAVL